MTHLNEHCTKECLFDASNPVERKYACDLCFRNPSVNTRMDFGKDIWGNSYSGTISPDGTVKTYVNGELLVRGIHPKNVNEPQWGNNEKNRKNR